MVASQILVSTNTFPQTKMLSVTPERGKKINTRSPPGAAEKKTARIQVPHESCRQCVSRRVHSTSVSRRNPCSLCWSGAAVWRRAPHVHWKIHRHGRAGHKIWSGIQSHPPQRGGGGWRTSTFAKIDLISLRIYQDTRGDGQVISDLSKRVFPECPQTPTAVLQILI